MSKINKSDLVKLAEIMGVDPTDLNMGELFTEIVNMAKVLSNPDIMVPRKKLVAAREEVGLLHTKALELERELAAAEKTIEEMRPARPVSQPTAGTAKLRMEALCPETKELKGWNGAVVRETGGAYVVRCLNPWDARVLAAKVSAALPDRWVTIQHGIEVRVSKNLKRAR